jgi:predicted nucleic acid-binding protein
MSGLREPSSEWQSPILGTLVLDASAAIRAVMEPHAYSELLTAIQNAVQVSAPKLFVSETANTLWKYHKANIISAEECTTLHADTLMLVTHWIDEQSLFPEALKLACALAHPVYGAIYLVGARRQAAQLMTCDKRLYALCLELRIDAKLFTHTK